VSSDFYRIPSWLIRTVEPLRFHGGNELILFHVLDPKEINPGFRKPVLLVGHVRARTRWTSRRSTRRQNYRMK